MVRLGSVGRPGLGLDVVPDVISDHPLAVLAISPRHLRWAPRWAARQSAKPPSPSRIEDVPPSISPEREDVGCPAAAELRGVLDGAEIGAMEALRHPFYAVTGWAVFQAAQVGD